MFCVIVPLIALSSYLTIQDVSQQRISMKAASELLTIAKEGDVIDTLVHELQRERGFSAGFIASSGKNFASQLQDQRIKTISAFDTFTQEIAFAEAAWPLVFQEVSRRLSNLSRTRAAVDANQVSVAEMADYYTDLINTLLLLNQPSHRLDQFGIVKSWMTTRAMVSSAKENAGLELAMGATGLGGEFTKQVYERYISLIGAQNALLSQAEQNS